MKPAYMYASENAVDASLDTSAWSGLEDRPWFEATFDGLNKINTLLIEGQTDYLKFKHFVLFLLFRSDKFDLCKYVLLNSQKNWSQLLKSNRMTLPGYSANLNDVWSVLVYKDTQGAEVGYLSWNISPNFYILWMMPNLKELPFSVLRIQIKTSVLYHHPNWTIDLIPGIRRVRAV